MTSTLKRKVLRETIPLKTEAEVDVGSLRNVVADWDGKWICFPHMTLAKQIVPINQHYRIYTDPIQMREKLGIRKMVVLGKKYGCTSDMDLWIKLQMNAFDPAKRYEDLAKIEQTKRAAGEHGSKITRYKRKIDYRFLFDPTSDAHMAIYGRLSPQACAILDIMYAGLKNKTDRVYREDELRGLIELQKDLLHTRQDSWRIFQYYRGTLIGRGYLRFHRENSAQG